MEQAGQPLQSLVSRPEPQVGSVLAGRYRVLERLASGSMGVVYRVEHLELQKEFALKLMKARLTDQPDFVARFRNEAMVVSELGNRHLVAISDFGREDDRFYFLMELVEGRTLNRALRQDGAFSLERSRHIGLQLAQALTAAHEHGVVHRDLKPENVMLTTHDGDPDFVKVLDFGVAKRTAPAGTLPATALTTPGALLGTPEYMAPEMVLGLPADHRVDLYALGLVLHEMLTGRRTFNAVMPYVFRQQVEDPPDPLVPLGVPHAYAELVMQLLAKKADDRPATMREVAERLEALDLEGLTEVTALPSSPAAADARTQVNVPGTLESVHELRVPTLVAGDPMSGAPTGPVSMVAVPTAAMPAPRVLARPSAPRSSAPRPSAPRSSAPRSSAPRTYAPPPVEEAPAPEPSGPSTDQALAAVTQRSPWPLVLGGVALAVAVGLGLLWSRTGTADKALASSSRPAPASPLGAAVDESPAGTVAGDAPAARAVLGATAEDAPADRAPEPARPAEAARQLAAPEPEEPSTRPSAGPRAPPKPAAPRTVKLTLVSTPPGAEVMEGDVLLGVTPVTLERPVDTLTVLTLSLKQRATVIRAVRLQADTRLDIDLAPLAAGHRAAATTSGSNPAPLKEIEW